MRTLVFAALAGAASVGLFAESAESGTNGVAIDDIDVSFAVSFAEIGVKGPVTVVHATNMLEKTVMREGDAVKVVWKGSAFAGKDFTVTAKIGTGGRTGKMPVPQREIARGRSRRRGRRARRSSSRSTSRS